MKFIVAALLLIEITLASVRPVDAQSPCEGAAEGVDLAVEFAHWVVTEESTAVTYAIRNEGATPSTSFTVMLMVDGEDTGLHQEFNRGLSPARRRRWEFEVPGSMLPLGPGHFEVQVRTAGADSPAGPAYADTCADNDTLPVQSLEEQEEVSAQGALMDSPAGSVAFQPADKLGKYATMAMRPSSTTDGCDDSELLPN